MNRLRAEFRDAWKWCCDVFGCDGSPVERRLHLLTVFSVVQLVVSGALAAMVWSLR